MSKLTKSFISNNPPQFDSSMLKVGEMMEVENCDRADCDNGTIIIKLFSNNLLDLSNMQEWNKNTESMIPGRKLLPGESITLTQE